MIHKLTPPSFSVEEVFMTCINNRNDKQSLYQLKEAIIADSEDFENRAESEQLIYFESDPHIQNNREHKKALENLYTNKLAAKGTEGRTNYYEKIKSTAPYGKCPLCGYSMATQLDHYLPKSQYSSLSITPTNLVPICKDCNFSKGTHAAKNSEDLPIHPYYDDLSEERWLYARIDSTDIADFSFYVSAPNHWGNDLIKRLSYQFEALGLSDTYALLAADYLSEHKGDLIELLEMGGPEEVKKHLQDNYEKAREHQLNYWKTALLHNLSSNYWFLKIGINNLKHF